MFNFFSVSDNSSLVQDEFHKLRVLQDMVRIADTSCKYYDILQALASDNNRYYSYDGEKVEGQAEFIALHRSSIKWPSAFVHTVLIKCDIYSNQIYPLFLESGQVRIGRWPVGAGVIVNFAENADATVKSTSRTDLFAGLQSLGPVQRKDLRRFTAAYSLDAMKERWDHLKALGTISGFTITTETEMLAGEPVYKLHLQHQRNPNITSSYVFYFREGCQKQPAMRGINAGTYIGPTDVFFKGPAGDLLENYVDNVRLHETTEAPI